MDVLSVLAAYGVVPVIRCQSPTRDALPLAKALTEAGLPIAEITFRTEGAAEAIRIMKQAYPDMCVGAGTILTEAQIEEAAKAGADFLVTPGLDADLVRYAQSRALPILPGVMSASDLHRAHRLGLSLVKFFPAVQAGGVPMLKALSAPFPMFAFMPTGGITEDNLIDFLRTPHVMCCGASYLAPDALIACGDFKTITARCRAAVQMAKEARKHG